jgi:hypothetical protein
MFVYFLALIDSTWKGRVLPWDLPILTEIYCSAWRGPLAKELIAANKFQTANRKPALPKWKSQKTMHAPALSSNVNPQKRGHLVVY